jgi:hypothetical protein
MIKELRTTESISRAMITLLTSAPDQAWRASLHLREIFAFNHTGVEFRLLTIINDSAH